jgi:hypothetical protein
MPSVISTQTFVSPSSKHFQKQGVLKQQNLSQAQYDPNQLEYIMPPATYHYPKAFVDTQIAFAKKWSELSGEPLTDSMLHHTFLFRMVVHKKYKHGEDVNPKWLEMLASVDPSSSNLSEGVYSYYTKQRHSHAKLIETKDFFNIESKDDHTVELHFQRWGMKMFSTLHVLIRRIVTNPQITHVYSASWLNDLVFQHPRFRRLLPDSYFLKMRLVDPNFRGISLWGQFIDSSHHLNTGLADRFIESINTTTSIPELQRSFPYSVKEVRIPIQDVLDFSPK